MQYKLSRIFTELLITAKMDEMEVHLLWKVGTAVLVDMLILIVFSSLSPFRRVYHEGEWVVVDELRHQQFVYGVCSIADSAVSYAFYVCVGTWKLVEMIYGIYVSIVVSRMSFKSVGVLIAAAVVIYGITAILLAFGPIDEPDFKYAVLCGTTLLVVHMVMFQKVITRWLIKRDLESNPHSKYTEENLLLNDEEQMKKLLITRLQEIAKNENWAREVSSTVSAGIANETIQETDESTGSPENEL